MTRIYMPKTTHTHTRVSLNDLSSYSTTVSCIHTAEIILSSFDTYMRIYIYIYLEREVRYIYIYIQISARACSLSRHCAVAVGSLHPVAQHFCFAGTREQYYIGSTKHLNKKQDTQTAHNQVTLSSWKQYMYTVFIFLITKC